MAAQIVTFKTKITEIFREIAGHPIEFEWTLFYEGTEDAGGSYFEATYQMGLMNPQVYYAITDILIYSTGDDTCQMRVYDNEWYNLNCGMDNLLSIYTGDGGAAGILSRDSLFDMIYLGKPRNAGSGEFGRIIVRQGDNAGALLQHIYVSGVAFKDQLPLTTIRRPNPLWI